MTTKRIFISYKREDRPRVNELAENLRRAGNIVWFDESLQVGDHWWDAILDQIELCDVIVCAISQRALRSMPCQQERAYAAAIGKPLLLIQVGPLTAVPTEYATIQFGDFSHGDLRALIDLTGALNRLPTSQPINLNVVRPAAPIALIEELSAILDTQVLVDFNDQIAILYRLKEAISDLQNRKRALELIETLRKKSHFEQIQEECQKIIALNKPQCGRSTLILGIAFVFLVMLGIGWFALSASQNNTIVTATPRSTVNTVTAIVPVTVLALLPPISITSMTSSVTQTPFVTKPLTISATASRTVSGLDQAKTLRAGMQTQTATFWTRTATENATEILNANLTLLAMTDSFQFNASQTAIAAMWTPTPTLTYTPTSTFTVTSTFTPSNTPTPTLIPAGTLLTPTVYAQMTQKDMPFVYVPRGCFQMGSDPLTDSQSHADEQPPHEVCITNGFWIGKYTVTNAQFAAYEQATSTKRPITADCQAASSDAKQPAVCVSAINADSYAHWFGCRLPTEAEWEYAARGPAALVYPWGTQYEVGRANIDEVKSKISGGVFLQKTAPVGSYEWGKSWIGAYDMVGNVWQWVSDWYSATYYSSAPHYDPPGPTSGTNRLVRGGSWGSLAGNARTAVRHSYGPDFQGNYFGFRLVCTQSIP